MPRFFIEPQENISLPDSGHFYITGENARHISRSLRMKTGESLVLCDGKGLDAHCRIAAFTDQTVEVEILSLQANTTEPSTHVHIYQGLPKADKLESVAQKAAELGAVSVTPVLCKRCIAKIDEKSAQKKTERLQKILLEAAKQSGRGKIPQAGAPLAFEAAMRRAAEAGTVLFFYEAGGMPLSEILPRTAGEISIFIGPEGGFDPAEADFAEKIGAHTVTLGPRILRTETAPIAALSVILYAIAN